MLGDFKRVGDAVITYSKSSKLGFGKKITDVHHRMVEEINISDREAQKVERDAEDQAEIDALKAAK